MRDLQSAKRIVLDYYRHLDGTDGDSVADVVRANVADPYLWRGFHPFEKRVGAQVSTPFRRRRRSVRALVRRAFTVASVTS